MIVKRFLVSVAVADVDAPTYTEQTISESVHEALTDQTIAWVHAEPLRSMKYPDIADPDSGDDSTPVVHDQEYDRWITQCDVVLHGIQAREGK